MAVKRFRRSAGNANVVMEVGSFSAKTKKTDGRQAAAFRSSLPLTLLSPLKNHDNRQAKRRRQFENSQDKAKRKDKEVRMRRSKRYQYQATTAEDSAAAGGGPGALEPAPFAEFFSPAADAFVGSLAGSRE